MKDYYKILEISYSATFEEIKRSYRRLAFIYHPDKNANSKSSEEKFKEIQEAYEILSNEETKWNYDNKYFANEESDSQTTQSNSSNSNEKKYYTANDFLDIIIGIRTQVFKVGSNRINHFELFRSLNNILSEEIIEFLLYQGDVNTNLKIIDESILCINYLDYSQASHFSIRLAKLAGSDNKKIVKIYSFIKRKKNWHFAKKYAKPSIGVVIIIIFIIFAISNKDSNSYSKNSNRPNTGNLYNETPKSITENKNYEPDIKKDLRVEDKYEGWEEQNYKTGNKPDCFNFNPKYSNLDNKLEVVNGATDVVIKLINTANNKCIRYVYIKSSDSYSIKNIPEGKYVVKIAYGSDWRQKIENRKCVGKFMWNASYEEGKEILDFNRVREKGGYKLPYYSLRLNVRTSSFSDQFRTNGISEESFNE